MGWSAWLDINPEGVSKGAALEAIRRRLGVEPMHTVAVGDQRNDLEMLQLGRPRGRDGQRPGRGQGRRRRGHRCTSTTTGWSRCCAPCSERLGVDLHHPTSPHRNPPQHPRRWEGVRMDTTEATTAAREAGNSAVVEWGARLGYVALGIIHLLIAWIALKVAWGIGGRVEERRHLRGAADHGAARAPASSCCGSASSASSCSPCGSCSRPRSATARPPTGSRRPPRASPTCSSRGRPSRWARAPGSSAEEQTEDFTAGLMGSPGGRLLVGVVGLVVLGIAGYHVYKGWTKKFLEDLREHPGDWAVTAGRIGYIAKGVALVIVGLLLPRRGLAGRPRQGAGPRRRAEDRSRTSRSGRSC